MGLTKGMSRHRLLSMKDKFMSREEVIAKMNLKTYLTGTSEEKANMTRLKNRFHPLFPVLQRRMANHAYYSGSQMELVDKFTS